MPVSAEHMLEPFSPDNTQLMWAVQASVYGEALAPEIRYDRYNFLAGNVSHTDLPEPLKQEVAHQWAEDLLDADVSNLQHMPFTALIGQYACQLDGLSQEDTNRVTRALLVHDLIEAKVGDATQGDATYDEDHARGHDGFKEDHQTLKQILKNHFADLLTDQDIDEIQQDMDDSKHEGAAEPATKIGRHIEIAERIGYIHSGLRAHQAAVRICSETERLSELPEQYYALIWMAENTISNSLARLVQLAPNNPSVMTFLRDRKEQLDYAIGDVMLDSDRVWQMYRDDGKDEAHVVDRQDKFGVAVKACFVDADRLLGQEAA